MNMDLESEPNILSIRYIFEDLPNLQHLFGYSFPEPLRMEEEPLWFEV